MAEELEIKLSLKSGDLVKALNWLLAQPEAQAGSKKSLVNCYYDTPDAELNHQQAALRVRKAGSHYVQTLKTRGEFVDGAHRREEWRSEEHTSELQSRPHLVCRLLLEKKK